MQADDCCWYGYTWVTCPDDSVTVVDQFDPRTLGYDYPVFYKVVPKHRDNSCGSCGLR